MKAVRWLHTWLGLIIVIQALVWSVSGLVMTLLPEENVSGIAFANQAEESREVAPQFQQQAARILERFSGAVSSYSVSTNVPGLTVLKIQPVMGGPVYYHLEKESVLRIDAKLASAIARNTLNGEPQILFAGLVESEGMEFDGPFPVWKVIAANEGRSHLYISPASGKVLAHRTSFWRWHRYSFLLHTFNFAGAGTINNPILSLMALIMFASALTGVVLLVLTFFRLKTTRK